MLRKRSFLLSCFYIFMKHFPPFNTLSKKKKKIFSRPFSFIKCITTCAFTFLHFCISPECLSSFFSFKFPLNFRFFILICFCITIHNNFFIPAFFKWLKPSLERSKAKVKGKGNCPTAESSRLA